MTQPPTPAGPAWLTDPAAGAVQAPARVLLVEDSASQRTFLRQTLESAGYAVAEAPDGETALTCIKSMPLAVAVVDLNLPGTLQGSSVLSAMVQVAPEVRTIVVSASPTLDNMLAVLRLGAFDFFPKPVDPALLLEKVKRAAEAHAQSATRERLLRQYEALFEVVPGVVCFLTEDGNFRRVNAEGARILGYDAQDLAGQPCDMLLRTPENSNTQSQWLFKERRTGHRATRHQILELTTKTGSHRTFHFCATGVYDRAALSAGPQFMGTIGVGWDVTEQRALEHQLQQAQKMDAVGRLAGGIAHDFNNLLSVINANARLLRAEMGRNHPLSEMTLDIEEAGRRAAQLTRQLLMFSRKTTNAPTRVNLSAVIESFKPMLRRLLDENIEVVCPVEPAWVLADRTQLDQLLMNLAINARDAMPNGGTLNLACSVTTVAAAGIPGMPLLPGSYAVLTVSDTGTGMDAATQEHLFEPFFTTKSPDKGTGLGLAVAYGVIKQHQGHVQVESSPGHGSTFTIYLPAAQATAEEGEQTRTASFQRGGETVLVVEDDEMVRRLVNRTLTGQGYQVVEASNGEEALKVFEEHHGTIALVVTDVVMPRMGGGALALELRKRHNLLPVLYMSGYIDRKPEGAPLLQERAMFMEKPVEVGQFLQRVRALLDVHEPAR